jgi:transposase
MSVKCNYFMRQYQELRAFRRPEGAKGFVLLPKRWVVERTFAWLGRCRRLSVDREWTTLSCEAIGHSEKTDLFCPCPQ